MEIAAKCLAILFVSFVGALVANAIDTPQWTWRLGCMVGTINGVIVGSIVL